MASLACSKMKPATPLQLAMYSQHGNRCTEKNAINLVRWYQRRKLHFMAIDIIRDYFKGINHGRT